MRDPNRIKPFMARLEKIWLTVPDMRFTQLIKSIVPHKEFYVEDHEVLAGMDNIEKAITGSCSCYTPCIKETRPACWDDCGCTDFPGVTPADLGCVDCDMRESK